MTKPIDPKLAKFIAESKIKDRLYHATTKDFKEFKPGGYDPKISGHAIWLSTDPKRQPAAHHVGSHDNPREGTRIMPVHVQAKNPMVLDDKAMLEWAQAVYANGSKEFPEMMPKEWADKVKEDYDSIIHADPHGRGDPHEIIMFHPNKIKSAIGNRGTYDTTKDDITMAKGGEVSVTDVKKRRDDKIPELELAAKALLSGVISRAEYDKTVKKYKPVTQYKSVPRPASDDEALEALHENKRQHWRGADAYPEGHPVGLRLDIPAYSDHGVWVNSVHDESGAKNPVKYAPVSAVRNAEFDPGPSKAQRVATGETNKSPFAKIKGEWSPMTDDEAVEHIKKHLNHPDYVQVGYDPRRRDYFYHRGDTRKPITHAEHVVQIGPLVLAKNPVYGKRKDFGLKDGGVAHMAEGGSDDDYRGSHQAPGPHFGAPMHDVTNGMYPEDFYGPNGARYYGDINDPSDREAHRQVLSVRGKPNAMVTIHRAVPTHVHEAAMKTKDPVKHMIRPGDWVAIHKAYAKVHGEGPLKGKYKIASMRVPAKHVWTNADSIHEWGYHPEEKKARGGRVTHAHHLDIEERPL